MNDTTCFIGLVATWLYMCSSLCELANTLACGLVPATKNCECGEILKFWFDSNTILIENLFLSPSASPFSWWVWFESLLSSFSLSVLTKHNLQPSLKYYLEHSLLWVLGNWNFPRFTILFSSYYFWHHLNVGHKRPIPIFFFFERERPIPIKYS